jgi:hypothetical protein
MRCLQDGGLTYSWAPPAGFFQLAELLVVAGEVVRKLGNAMLCKYIS